jgi:hypothetical protein
MLRGDFMVGTYNRTLEQRPGIRIAGRVHVVA